MASTLPQPSYEPTVLSSTGTDSTTSSSIYFSEADPNGAVSAGRPAICYASNGTTWIKTGSGNNATGWVMIMNGGAS